MSSQIDHPRQTGADDRRVSELTTRLLRQWDPPSTSAHDLWAAQYDLGLARHDRPLRRHPHPRQGFKSIDDVQEEKEAC